MAEGRGKSFLVAAIIGSLVALAACIALLVTCRGGLG